MYGVRHRGEDEEAMNENAIKFRDLLIERPALKEQMRHVAESYRGDRENDRAVFEAVIVPVARECSVK